MPRSLIRLFAALGLVVGLSAAFADPNPSHDVHVNVNAGPANKVVDALPVNRVGKALFRIQEGAHRAVKQTTGTSVDHHYIWIGVGHQSVPVDPFEFSR